MIKKQDVPQYVALANFHPSSPMNHSQPQLTSICHITDSNMDFASIQKYMQCQQTGSLLILRSKHEYLQLLYNFR